MQRSSGGAIQLSPREEEVCRLVCSELSNEQIALAMGISHGSARNYLSALYRGLNLKGGRVSLALWWVNSGVLRRAPGAEVQHPMVPAA